MTDTSAVRHNSRKNGTTVHFWADELDVVSDLVTAHHYTHRPVHAVSFCGAGFLSGGLFGDKGRPVCGLTFSVPPTRWSEPVLELSRLVRVPDVDLYLTAFISWACRQVHRRNLADLLVSFADASLHHGGIYQAASWQFHVLRQPSNEGIQIGDRFIPGRMANNLYGTRSIHKLRQRGIDAVAVKDSGKYLYWKALSRRGRQQAKRLGLMNSSYPKPTHVIAGPAED